MIVPRRPSVWAHRWLPAFTCFFALLLGVFPNHAYAVHPLLTDETSTQGAGKFALETDLEYGRKNSAGVVNNTPQVNLTLFSGIADSLDLIVTSSYFRLNTRDRGAGVRTSGIGDTVVLALWRFYEKEGLSFAIKPLVAFPTGNSGIGNGKVSYGNFLIATYLQRPFIFSVNLDYFRNENVRKNRKDIWRVSGYGGVEVVRNFRLVQEFGTETNRETRFPCNWYFSTTGVIWSVTDYLDLDAGVMLLKHQSDFDYRLAGAVTLKF